MIEVDFSYNFYKCCGDLVILVLYLRLSNLFKEKYLLDKLFFKIEESVLFFWYYLYLQIY